MGCDRFDHQRAVASSYCQPGGGAQDETVENHGGGSSDSPRDPCCEREQGHPDVVGQNEGRKRSKLFATQTKVGSSAPRIGHPQERRRDQGGAHLGPDQGECCSERSRYQEQPEGEGQQAPPFDQKPPIASRIKFDDSTALAVLGVHESARSHDEALEADHRLLVWELTPSLGEIRGSRSIEGAESEDLVIAQTGGSGSGLGDQFIEFNPGRLIGGNEPLKIHTGSHRIDDMTFDRTAGIDTPEGVRLDLTLAGVGSRVGAQLIDGLIKLAIWLVLFFSLGSRSEFGFTLVFVLYFLVALLVYELVFEALWAGRTPGKAAFGIRVVSSDGSPARFSAIVVRNLLRLVDILPIFYAVALVGVFATKRHQRLGDLAAGTIVIRERKGSDSSKSFGMGMQFDVPSGFDATTVSAHDVAIVRQFLGRVDDLDWATVTRLASRIAEPLRPKVFIPGGRLDDLDLLRAIVGFKAR